MKNKKNRGKFISVIWGYSTHIYGFTPEEKYHLHILKVAKDLGFKPYVIIKGSKQNIMNDPHFDTDIKVIDYKNDFQFFFHIIKFSFQNSLFYVNSYEWRSFIIPFLAHRTIFMAHTQPKRQTKLKQMLQKFVYNFFTAIRLNNEEEEKFLIKQGTPLKKLFVIPLVVSQNIFKLKNTILERKDLVYFGNITEVKNVNTILKALKEVSYTVPEIKLHIIGEIYNQVFLDEIKTLELSNNIILHGFMNQDNILNDLLNTILISLNSSKIEGNCVAIFDTALCGCALCLPKIMSFKGVFKDTALFHEVFDYKQLSKNILFFLDNKDIIKKYKEKNINMIKNNYSKKIIEKKLKELILKI